MTKHALVQIMHGSRIWRAPYKDCFHGINGVTKTGDEGEFLVRLFLIRGWGSSGLSECQTVTPTMDYK